MINIITRCTRPYNLPLIKKTIPKECNWIIIFDCSVVLNIETSILTEIVGNNVQLIFDKSNHFFYGYDMLNRAIKNVNDEHYIYILDDDTYIHPDFNNIKPDEITIFNQYVGGKDFSGLELRLAIPENMFVSKVDIGQIIFKKKYFIDFTPSYHSDGYFIEELYKKYESKFTFVDSTISLYNAIEQPIISGLPKTLFIGLESNYIVNTTVYNEYECGELKQLTLDSDFNINATLKEFDPDSIVTIGDDYTKYTELNNLCYDFRKRWIHLNDKSHIGDLAYNAGMHYILDKQSQPLFSFFTPIYNTGDTIVRTYNSIKNQTNNNWEWVVVNDSNDYRTYDIVDKIRQQDARVKLYDFKEKSNGFIGESKYRAAMLCRGDYLIEIDHDDYILPNLIETVYKSFLDNPDAGFAYSDCCEIDDNHNSLTYPDGFCFGYGSYRDEHLEDRYYKVCNSPNINPKTIRHIVGVPNHVRVWKKDIYLKIGGHNRRLSIADDYELIVRTFLETKMIKINKLLYLQYIHNNNTQNKTRGDIQRRVRTISNFYNEKIKNRFKELGLFDWAYNDSPNNPLLSQSRYGDEEQKANYIWN